MEIIIVGLGVLLGVILGIDFTYRIIVKNKKFSYKGKLYIIKEVNIEDE